MTSQAVAETKKHVDGTLFDQKSRSATTTLDAPAPPKNASLPNDPFSVLPAELVLELACEADFVTGLQMAFTCRDWYFLIIPEMVHAIIHFRSFREKPAWQRNAPRVFASEKDVATFARDSLAADKFSALYGIGGISRPSEDLSLWFLRSGLISSCTGLRELTLETNSAEHFVLLSTCSLPELKRLEIYPRTPESGTVTIEDDTPLSFSLSNLQELELHNFVPAAVANGLAKSCPKLDSTTWDLWGRDDYVQDLVSLSDAFLATIKVLKLEPGPLFLSFLRRKAFRPATIDHEDDPVNIDYYNPTEIWGHLVKLTSLEHLRLLFLPSECLLHGVPPNLQALHLSFLDVSGLSQDDLQLVRSQIILISQQMELSIHVDEECRNGLSIPQLYAFRRELCFWAELEGVQVSIADADTRDDKLAVAQRVAEEVQEEVDEIGGEGQQQEDEL